MITLVCFIFFLSSHLECNLIVQVNEVHMIVYELAIFFHYLTELKTTFNTHQQLILTHESDCIPFVFHCSSTYIYIIHYNEIPCTALCFILLIHWQVCKTICCLSNSNLNS